MSKMENLPYWHKDLTPEMVRKAKEELGETKEVREEGLKELRRLINREKDFRPMMDDNFLLRFLRAKKFDVENAFKGLLNYYTFKVRYSGVITDFRPSQIKKTLEMMVMAPLPSRLPDGSIAGLLRLGYLDANAVTADELLAACLVCGEVGFDSEANQVCGGALIIDMDKFGWRHIRKFASPTFLYRLIRLVQYCIPLRVKGFHVINEPFYVHVVFNTVKRLVSEKIRSRIFFHGKDLQSLYKFFPPETLPEEVGGSLGPMDRTEFLNRVLDKEAYFEKAIKYGYQEKRAQFIKKRSSSGLLL